MRIQLAHLSRNDHFKLGGHGRAYMVLSTHVWIDTSETQDSPDIGSLDMDGGYFAVIAPNGRWELMEKSTFVIKLKEGGASND